MSKIKINGISFKDEIDNLAHEIINKKNDPITSFYFGVYLAAKDMHLGLNKNNYLCHGGEKVIEIEKLREMLGVEYLAKKKNIYTDRMLDCLIGPAAGKGLEMTDRLRNDLLTNTKFLQEYKKIKEVMEGAIEKFINLPHVQSKLQEKEIRENVKKPKKTKHLKI